MSEPESDGSAQAWFARQRQGTVEEAVREALRGVIDPELGINIVDLGLVYETTVSDAGRAEVVMTLTSPGCPLGAVIQEQITQALAGVFGIQEIAISIVWSPRWTPAMMSEDARLELGYW
ncbi:MAG: metal-sulfur cluster assembly factor [Chloroflexi bacterium]|nr:metal-sulfur cluster assembly factor [Chloroflexota bacterium]